MLRRHDGCGWPRECARRGLDIAGGCAMIHECDMVGSDNYVDILQYGGYERLCWCLCRLEVVDDSIGRIISVLMNYIMQVSMTDYMFGASSVLGSSRACI